MSVRADIPGVSILKKIDIENHFATEAYIDALYKNPGYPRFVDDDSGLRRVYHAADYWQPFGDALLDRLRDLDDMRIAAMDVMGIEIAVLSHTAPGPEQLETKLATPVVKDANDTLAEAISRHPNRYLGFAALAPKEPDEAVKELHRCVKEWASADGTLTRISGTPISTTTLLAHPGQVRGVAGAHLPPPDVSDHQATH